MFRHGKETLQRPSEFIGKLVERHAQSPVRKFKLLAVIITIFIDSGPLSQKDSQPHVHELKFIQYELKNCQILVKCSQVSGQYFTASGPFNSSVRVNGSCQLQIK